MVDFSKFAKWAKNRFGEENILVKGKEIRINSIFSNDDSSYHLWCSPSGGKKKRKGGVYHCFKTDKKGSLIKLVQIVDSCDREDAITILEGRTSIRDLEKQLEEFFADPIELEPVITKPELSLPLGCELISNLGTNNWWRKKAEEYLTNRLLPIDGLYVCTEDKYKYRIIIPYYDRNGKLIYWNARHMGKSKCKYLGPPKEVGVGKEDVVFMAGSWPSSGETLYLCEGEFNAISLKLCELNAAACGGKNMSDKQALIISEYKIVLCLDRDKAGKQGTTKMTSMISAIETVRGNERLKFVIPPPNYNDWNEMLIKLGPTILFHYIQKEQKSLDYFFPYGNTSACINNILD
jgi:hypothetical protein